MERTKEFYLKYQSAVHLCSSLNFMNDLLVEQGFLDLDKKTPDMTDYALLMDATAIFLNKFTEEEVNFFNENTEERMRDRMKIYRSDFYKQYGRRVK